MADIKILLSYSVTTADIKILPFHSVTMADIKILPFYSVTAADISGDERYENMMTEPGRPTLTSVTHLIEYSGNVTH